MNELLIPVSVGELLDKLSILKIKREKIKDDQKLSHIINEFDLIERISSDFLIIQSVSSYFQDLYAVNEKLWEIEERIRIKEQTKEFDSEFIELARSVYLTNDDRFNLKNKINEITNSLIKEQKSY
jgi:hypothetical protein